MAADLFGPGWFYFRTIPGRILEILKEVSGGHQLFPRQSLRPSEPERV